MPFNTKDVVISEDRPKVLLMDKHSDYLASYGLNKDDYEYCMTEYLRMSGIYWSITAMELMGQSSRMPKEDIIEFITSCQDTDSGGIAASIGHDPHILYTLSAVQVLAIYDRLEAIDVEGIVRYVASLQQDDGSFFGDKWGEVDTRFSFCAVMCLSLLHRLDAINVTKAVDFVLSCMNFDGGFGSKPGSESHAGLIYCCVGLLSICKRMDALRADELAWWLCERQLPSGGLNGRPEKLPDLCYSWEFMEEKFNELLYEPSGQFANFCRMSYSDFEFLLNAISPMISKKNTDFREAIPAKYRLAITLRYLATGDSYKNPHYLFKTSTQIISEIIPEVCKAINEVLKDEIKMPSSSEGWLNIEREFRNKFPHACGSMDGKHIVIESPPHSGSEYHNYKRTFSIVLLALVDSNYNFIFVDIGSQGRISNGGVYNNSLLWQKIVRNEMNFPEPCPLPAANNNISLPYVFLADGAFALNTHVMKPYPGNHEIGSPKRIFNQHLSRARVVVENAFGILSSVFRIFRKPINLKIETVNDITMTCVLLHNFFRKSVTFSKMYTPGTLDVYDNNGNLIRGCAWRNINGYNAIQNLPHVPRRPPLTGVNIRNEFTSYFC